MLRTLVSLIVTALITLVNAPARAQTTPNYILCEQALFYDVNGYHHDATNTIIGHPVYDTATLTKQKGLWDFSLFSSNAFASNYGVFAVTLTEASYNKDPHGDPYCQVTSAGWQTSDRSDNPWCFLISTTSYGKRTYTIGNLTS
jgi:hypothetical protein